MKQLLIVNSAKALNAYVSSAATPYNLATLDAGAIAFYELDASTLLDGSAAPTKNFAIALGKGANLPPVLIPEVDIETLEITKALPVLGTVFTGSFTMPTTVVGKEYTVIVTKLGTVPNERNTYTFGIAAGSTTAATEAAALETAATKKINAMGLPLSITASDSTVTVAGTRVGDQWAVTLADGLASVSFSGTPAKQTIGDKAYVAKLAQQCAAGKGFNYTDQASKDLYPGYPEAVEDLTPNNTTQGSSTTGYALFSLHFATKRKSGKTGDELVWQYVHIAVPVTMASSGLSKVATILPEGKFSDNMIPAIATADSPSTGVLTKAVADTLYDPL